MPEEVNQPTIQNKAGKPPGVLPRNTQTWVIIGLAAVMIAAIAFSSGPKPQERSQQPSTRTPAVIDPNQTRINEYRNRIDEQARRLAAEQAELMQARQAAGLAPTGAVGSQPPGSSSGVYPPPGYTPTGYAPEPRTQKSDIQAEKEKREYLSLFASNVALTYRPDAPKPQQDRSLQATPAPPVSVYPGYPYAAPPPQHAVAVQPTNPEPGAGDEDRHDSANDRRERAEQDFSALNRAEGKGYRLFEGTVLETVLTNRLNGAFAGPVNCMVTTDVYSHDRQRLLIPKGSRVLGEAKQVDNFGQQRLAVVFHRIIMPDGYSVSLDQFQGLNQIGETGLRDKVNRHYAQVFGVSLAIGAIAGLAQANTRYGLEVSGTDAYRQGVAASLSQSSMRILDRFLNILPTFTIREGHRVKIYLAGDLLVPAYDRHTMPEDL